MQWRVHRTCEGRGHNRLPKVLHQDRRRAPRCEDEIRMSTSYPLTQYMPTRRKQVLEALLANLKQSPLDYKMKAVTWEPYPLQHPPREAQLTQDYLWAVSTSKSILIPFKAKYTAVNRSLLPRRRLRHCGNRNLRIRHPRRKSQARQERADVQPDSLR